MKRVLGTILIALLAAALFPISATATGQDAARQVDRMRVVMTTTSDWARLTVPDGEKIVNHKGLRTQGSAGTVLVEPTNFFIGQNALGSQTTVQYDILLSTDGYSDRQWKIEKGWGQRVHLEIYNINDESNPELIATHDNVTAQGEPYLFTISGQAESRRGPLVPSDVGPKKVFAVYYPWWTRLNNWQTNPQVGDAPTLPYDTQNRADVNRIINEAKAMGLDGFLASWQGRDNFSDVGVRELLAAASQRQDFSVGIYMETRVANSSHSHNQPPDPVYLKQWIRDLVGYGNDPANTSFLKMDGKPVIFVYWARDLSPTQWSQIFTELRQEGVDAYYIADYTGTDSGSYNDYLPVFDGMHIFNPSVYSSIPWVLSTRSETTRTYNLLTDPSAPRKLWVGTAVPGMNASRIGGNVVDRAQGATYSSLWNSNLDAGADWVMISTWNDYLENTHIESSIAFGNLYGDLTSSFVTQFKSGGTAAPPVIGGLTGSAFLPGGLEVNWNTDRPASAIFEYGTSPGLYTNTVRGNTNSSQHRLSASGLAAGTYYARVRSMGSNGVMATSSEFAITVPNETIPQLNLTAEQTYWSDYASYSAGILTVDFRMANSGNTDSVNTRIIHTQGSGGATTTGGLPSVGTVPAGGSVVMPIRWQLPSGISSFQANLWAQAATGSGTTVYYPGPPPAGN